LTYVQDAVRANIIASESLITGVINVGTGYRTTINELAQNITKIVGKDLQPIYKKPRVGDIRDSLADITLAKSIGYSCRYSLEDGLRETIRTFNNGN
jgi:UDP-glucose 4-epimerase